MIAQALMQNARVRKCPQQVRYDSLHASGEKVLQPGVILNGVARLGRQGKQILTAT